MKKTLFTFFVSMFLVFSSKSWAADDLSELKAMVQELVKQNQALSAKVKELEEKLKAYEASAPAVAPESEETALPKFSIEGSMRAGVVADSNEKGSDFGMPTVELAVSGSVNDWVSGSALILYENPPFADDDNVFIDEAFIQLGNPEKYPVYAKAGEFYVPFGALLTHFPDDPLVDIPITLSFGEIREKALLLGYEKAGLSASFYVFNGDVEEEDDSDNHVEDFGFDLNYTYEDEARGLTALFGLSYLSNLADTDGLSDAVGEVIKDKEGGLALYGEITFGRFFMLGEYMTALDDLETGDYKGEPAVWNVEAGVNCDRFIRPVEVVLKYAGSNNDAQKLEFAESRYGIAFNVELFENVGASVGYFHDDFDRKLVDDDTRDVFLGQVEISFGL
ncbi:LbtU family siderophore porin [Thermodesulfatator autotrophicus]|uniref:LbtU family siderophore porin n=1 Tax=Thermodesulfatator autotrophicus TaxID=1795632 RepID=A0A177E8V3_9BACT|nr:LbtU family siderophore porin [Thermodesulfatator autotrophicus]OAG28228.1 hypothetical protein TH606_02975 [Thermodesulfatator autotrophicus]